MRSEFRVTRDPRSIAREIPGILDALFPQLTPGMVTYFNRKGTGHASIERIPEEWISQSEVQHAMLFEIAIALAEQLLVDSNEVVDWQVALQIAVARQRRHFDAQVPDTLVDADKCVALQAAKNLVEMLLSVTDRSVLVPSPFIPGYRWIASGVGDFALGQCLVEVKCSRSRFSSSDYRQVAMYWLLSYAAAIQSGQAEWSEIILMNPRLNFSVRLPFDEIIDVASAGRSKVELVELFAAMVSDQRYT